MSVAVSRRFVAQSPSHRGEIAELHIRAAATLLLRSSRSGYALYALATTNALPRRLCFLGIVNLCGSATLRLRFWRSGQLQAWFKCLPKVGVALLDSRTNSERFHYRVIKNEELSSILIAFISWS